MATLELDLAEQAVSAPARKGRRLGGLFWAAIGWMVFVFALAIFANVLPIRRPWTCWSGVRRSRRRTGSAPTGSAATSSRA
jgi:hypothetical protein